MGCSGPERRKTGWMRAEAAGDPGPWRQQAVLGRSHWDADALRDLVRDYALETLASPGAVLVIDETGFLKQGQRSCGVGRQYTGSAGKITNCQIGVFAAYVSDKGCAFIDRQLYLPKDWTNKPERRTAAQVPDSIRFATKPEIAAQMIERAIAAGVPFDWVATDTVYGVGGSRCSCAGPARAMCSASCHGSVLLLGQDPTGGRHGRADRASPSGRGLEAPVGRRRHQGTAPVRLGLSSNCADLEAEEYNRAPHRPVDAGSADPAQPHGSGSGVLLDLVPGRHADRQRWCGSRAGAGRSRMRSRPPRPSSGWPTTRPAPGTAGIAMSRW